MALWISRLPKRGETHSLSVKVAIVTGAGKRIGIGRTIVKRYGREGASVVANDIDVELAQDAADTVNAADEARVTMMFSTTVERFGTVNILVNDAGLVSPTMEGLAGLVDQCDIP